MNFDRQFQKFLEVHSRECCWYLSRTHCALDKGGGLRNHPSCTTLEPLEHIAAKNEENILRGHKQLEGKAGMFHSCFLCLGTPEMGIEFLSVIGRH